MRGFGYRAAVAAPVSVGGRLWGALAAATSVGRAAARRGSSSGCATSPSSSRRRSPTPTRTRSSPRRAPRLVEVGDAERRRLERNLHDGAQQRLVAVALELGMARRQARQRSACRARAARDGAGRSRHGARRAARARPRHPPRRPHRARARRRARCAAEPRAGAGRDRGAARRAAAPRRSRRRRTTSSPRRSRTSRSTRTRRARRSPSRRSDGSATVTVSDDGAAGPTRRGGSGLRGLAARVEALNGRLDVDSPPGRARASRPRSRSAGGVRPSHQGCPITGAISPPAPPPPPLPPSPPLSSPLSWPDARGHTRVRVEQRQDPGPDPAQGRPGVRHRERRDHLRDARGAQGRDPLGDLLAGPGDGEAVDDRVGDQRARTRGCAATARSSGERAPAMRRARARRSGLRSPPAGPPPGSPAPRRARSTRRTRGPRRARPPDRRRRRPGSSPGPGSRRGTCPPPHGRPRRPPGRSAAPRDATPSFR